MKINPAHLPSLPGSWVKRRRLIWMVAWFCMACVGWVLYKDMQSAVADTAVSMSYITLMSLVGSYCFGATWDDKNARDHLGNKGEPAA